MDMFEARGARPMLIDTQRDPFDDPDYMYEMKFDGIRVLAYLGENETDIRNKRNMMLGPHFPELSNLNRQVNGKTILDGEVVILSAGKPDFEKLYRRVMMTDSFKIELDAQMNPATVITYDLLYKDKKEYFTTPLIERKEMLNKTQQESDRFAISRVFYAQGVALFQTVKEMGLEGVVAKRIKSLYYPGKATKDWIKFKNLIDEDLIACGYIPKGTQTSIVLGKQVSGQLVYEGHVTIGVPGQQVRGMKTAPHSPFMQTPPGHEQALWFAYMPVCTIEYMNRTKGGGMRQARFKEFRVGVLE